MKINWDGKSAEETSSYGEMRAFGAGGSRAGDVSVVLSPGLWAVGEDANQGPGPALSPYSCWIIFLSQVLWAFF